MLLALLCVLFFCDYPFTAIRVFLVVVTAHGILVIVVILVSIAIVVIVIVILMNCYGCYYLY